MQIKMTLFLILAAVQILFQNAYAQDCTVITVPGFIVKKPGLYCFGVDVFTRVDFADHLAEPALVEIQSSDVTIDMRGHRGGRAKLPFQKGGNGISIPNFDFGGDKYKNITIENGILSNFEHGIYYFYSIRGSHPKRQEMEKVGEDDYLYRSSNIKIINMRFVNCDEDIYLMDAF